MVLKTRKAAFSIQFVVMCTRDQLIKNNFKVRLITFQQPPSQDGLNQNYSKVTAPLARNVLTMSKYNQRSSTFSLKSV